MSVGREEALEYHARHPKGKTEVKATKPTENSRELSLAYTPGVAYPCLAIEKNPDLCYEYTNKGNLVGIITDGTSILGLGDIGSLAGKPVMEGKAVLFKKFAGIDVFDIELNSKSPEEIIRTIQILEPTFGGINLEDIKAPECFYIEQKLIETMNIPVFHDDQHGTAIIVTAALINALAINQKKPSEIRVVVSGAGAAAIAIARMIQLLDIRQENIFLVDTGGVISLKRKSLNEFKLEFARDTECTSLGDIMAGSDVFIGVSRKGLVTQEMVKSMNRDPIILALANPDPEIPYTEAIAARNDIIMGTGRSDYPNQVNNLLGFPYIFRGALDVRAANITMNMKLAASKALAELAREVVPVEVQKAYGVENLEFGRNYIIPKPIDARLLYKVSPAVAEAAVQDGSARISYPGREKYIEFLSKLSLG